jgi:hypothetical protein
MNRLSRKFYEPLRIQSRNPPEFGIEEPNSAVIRAIGILHSHGTQIMPNRPKNGGIAPPRSEAVKR